MAVAAWTASTAFSVGDIRRAATAQASGFWFKCIVAGTSGSSEPDWPKSLFRVDSSVDVNNADEVAANCLITHDNQCVTAGVVVDGSVTWKTISSTYEDLLVSNPSGIIELFQLRLDTALHGENTVYYFHAGTSEFGDGDIIFDSQTYSRIPIKAEGFEYTNSGTLPRPTLTVSNLASSITALLIHVNATTLGNDLGGAEVRRIRTLVKYLDEENFFDLQTVITETGDFLITESGDKVQNRLAQPNPTADPNARFPDERWFIDRKSSETRDIVQFELASKFDLAGQKIPRRQVVANICQWKYRSSECSYTGTDYYDVDGNEVSTEAQDVCGKRIASCKLRFGDNGELPFGSFPGAGLSR